MLSFLKKIFGAKPATQLEVEVKAEAPYKIEPPVAAAATEAPATPKKKPATKKTGAVKAPRKPRASKA